MPRVWEASAHEAHARPGRPRRADDGMHARGRPRRRPRVGRWSQPERADDGVRLRHLYRTAQLRRECKGYDRLWRQP